MKQKLRSAEGKRIYRKRGYMVEPYSRPIEVATLRRGVGLGFGRED